MLTIDECKKMLFNAGITTGVSPKLISERLLSADDKKDMLNGKISMESLITHVKVWKENGMCNYADGSGTPYKTKDELPMSRYSGYDNNQFKT